MNDKKAVIKRLQETLDEIMDELHEDQQYRCSSCNKFLYDDSQPCESCHAFLDGAMHVAELMDIALGYERG